MATGNDAAVHDDLAGQSGTRPGRPILGVMTPVVTLLPGVHARWEEHGTIEDIAAVAVPPTGWATTT